MRIHCKIFKWRAPGTYQVYTELVGVKLTLTLRYAMSLETTSLFSSIAEAPAYLKQQYSPLRDAFREHSAQLPDQNCPEPNSEG